MTARQQRLLMRNLAVVGAREVGMQARHVAALFGLSTLSVMKIYDRHVTKPDELPASYQDLLAADRAKRAEEWERSKSA